MTPVISGQQVVGEKEATVLLGTSHAREFMAPVENMRGLKKCIAKLFPKSANLGTCMYLDSIQV